MYECNVCMYVCMYLMYVCRKSWKNSFWIMGQDRPKAFCYAHSLLLDIVNCSEILQNCLLLIVYFLLINYRIVYLSTTFKIRRCFLLKTFKNGWIMMNIKTRSTEVVTQLRSRPGASALKSTLFLADPERTRSRFLRRFRPHLTRSLR